VQALEQAGLTATTANVPSNAAPGTVVAQAPAAGQRVDVGSSVRINVSGGPGAVTVPDVVGASADDAAAALQSAGLKAQTTEVPSDEPRGTVVSQSPTAGSQVARGSTVRLEISSGPAPVAVPDVVDQTEADARDALEAEGFRVRVVEEPAPDAESVGLVLRQVPAAGREAPSGTQVTIVVGV
jgi:serine/threonine-protein kinase